MSRIEELKNQNPDLKIDVIELFKFLFDKPKYVELFINISKKESIFNSSRKDIKQILRDNFYISEERMINKSIFELMLIDGLLRLIGHSNYEGFTDFISYNERKLIDNTDLSKYKSFDDIKNAVSAAELKLNSKELEKQIQKLYETNEWLVLKPLSWEASKKYGYNTKWCTSAKDDSYQFYKYSRHGVLIYCLNKLNGKKVAFYKSFIDKKISFWNNEDIQIDSVETDLPHEILYIIKEQIQSCLMSNFAFFNEDEIENSKVKIIFDTATEQYNPFNHLMAYTPNPITR